MEDSIDLLTCFSSWYALAWVLSALCATFYAPPFPEKACPMGAEWSAPSGRAEIPSSLLPFTAWGKDDLWMMRRRHKASLGGIFALKPEHFSRLLGIHRRTSDIIFKEIFDTDANGLVDAFESMCGMTLLCSASLAEKVDFAHSLFDFGLDGDLNLAEVTLLIRTVLFAGAKIDRRVQVSPTETLEELCCLAFDQAGVDHEGALAKHLFESFLFRNHQMTAFLQLWSGSASQVLIPKGTLWEDPDFPTDQSSLYLHEGLCPLGLPPSGTVRWLRPCEIAKGDQVVLFAGNLPGDCPLVPGQLADRWLLSAIAILTGRPQLLRSLFLHTGQEDQGRHCVRIFKSANWINVYVDSRIPCGLDEKVLFFHGEERHELWGYILEKAFAKAHGCYENLMHGETSEALRDLTGGVIERLQWAKLSCSSVAPTTKEPQATSLSTDIECGEAKSWIRLTGWGLPPGAMQSPEWIFDEMKDRILDGQVLGCSRQAWMRDPWGDEQGEKSTAIAKEDGGHTGKQRDTGCGSTSFGGGGKLFPLSNRIMRGLSSGVAYCVLEVFEIGGTRLVRLKDPWSGRVFGTEPGQYLGDWGPSSSLWSKNPALATKLLPRTLPGMFWMDLDDFLEVFNTLYAVDLAGDVDGQTPMIDHMTVSKEKGPGNKRVKKNREGRCEGSWDGGVCGGRFTEGSGWLEGTQAFLQIEPCLSKQPGRLEHPPSEIKAKKNEDRLARVLITLTQEDSRYHDKDYTSREERSRSIGFLVHSYKWSPESSGKIPKLSKIVQEGLNHVTQRFVPKRDVSCRLELPPGQYAIVPTTLEPGTSGRFWIHVKSDQNAILVQASAPDAAVTGSNPGECEMRLEEVGISLDVVYNEAEEDAEGNARTANMASIAELCSQLMSVALP